MSETDVQTMLDDSWHFLCNITLEEAVCSSHPLVVETACEGFHSLKIFMRQFQVRAADNEKTLKDALDIREYCITFSNIDQHRLHVIMSALKYDATRTSVCVAQDRGWAETQIRGKLRRKVKVSEVHFLV